MKRGKKFVGGQASQRTSVISGESKSRKRYQGGYEHDGWEFDDILKLDKFKASGPESKAVRRDRMTKALWYWGRGWLRYCKGDWEDYLDLDKVKAIVREEDGNIQKAYARVFYHVMAHSYDLEKSRYQKNGGRRPGDSMSVKQLEALLERDKFLAEIDKKLGGRSIL